MNIIHKILPRYNVLSAVFSSTDKYAVSLYECNITATGSQALAHHDVEDLSDLNKEISSFPVILAISGYGVISKDISSAPEITAKVIARDSGFTWNMEEESISFVKSEQIRALTDKLDISGAKILYNCIVAADATTIEKAVPERSNYLYKNLGLKTLLQPSVLGSRLGTLIANRLKLPVLGIVLLLLILNALISGGIRDEYQQVLALRDNLEKQRGLNNELSKERRIMLEEFTRSLPHDYSYLCDRAALAVPDNITLTSLAIQPPAKSPEDHKPLQLSQRSMVISGEAASSEDVSYYVTALQKLKFAPQVKLASIEQNQESGLLTFRINIEL